MKKPTLSIYRWRPSWNYAIMMIPNGPLLSYLNSSPKISAPGHMIYHYIALRTRVIRTIDFKAAILDSENAKPLASSHPGKMSIPKILYP